MRKTYLLSYICQSLFVLAYLSTCIGISNLYAQSNYVSSTDLSKADKINELVSLYAEYGKFNGTVLVAKEGKVIFVKGFGFANMEWEIPNQANTKFRLASVTKQFTAMLVMQLVSENKVALDVPISTYLPDYPQESGDKINIHHLLTHTSGIPNYTSFANYRDIMRKHMEPADIVDTFADSTLQFVPGQKFSYSNSGYVLLGTIIEKVTGKPFENVLREKILLPLKMKNTGYDQRKDVLKNRATGYNSTGSTITNANYIDMSAAYAAGGMYSTVEDLYLWDQALYTEKLLPKKYMDMVFKEHIPAWGKYYGYGWLIEEMTSGDSQDKIKTINHDGVINGFSSLIFRIPSDHSSILLLNNTGGAPLYEMSKAIRGILYNQPYDFPKKSLAHSLLEAIESNGLTQGVQYYETIKDDSVYYLDENELNMVSYEFLQSDRAKAAAEVLKLGIAAFPNAFNLYDSYAEVLVALGKNTEAIKNYKKSLALNPKNDNGIQMLKQLGVDINEEDLYLLKTDKSWTKEIFTFPLNFAKEMNYVGIEEAHFPIGWRKLESPEFWSYAFVWNINLTTKLTETQLANHLRIYFDGLMKVVNKDKERMVPKTVAKLYNNEEVDSVFKYTGTVKIFDAFVTEKIMTLNVLAESHYCGSTKKSIILFKFSPKEFGNEIWTQLENIKLRDHACDN